MRVSGQNTWRQFGLLMTGTGMLLTGAGCEERRASNEQNGITIERDKESGKTEIDVNLDGVRVDVEAGPKGAEANVDTSEQSDEQPSDMKPEGEGASSDNPKP